MVPYRKPFFGDPLFPFNMKYRDVKYPHNELPEHLHDVYELVYVYEGSGTFFIDHTLYEKSPGDLFIIPGNTIHRANPDEHNPIISTAVFFAPAIAASDRYDDEYSVLQCFDIARSSANYKLVLPDSYRRLTASAFDLLHEELDQRTPGYRAAIRLELRRLLLQLSRYLSQQLNVPHSNRLGPPWMRNVLQEIGVRPERRYGLSELAGQASVSAAHFSRVFKQLTGMNVTNYVNTKRIIRAKELLLESDLSIPDVAERCGFESIPHFHRLFKALTDFTPGAYRKAGKETARAAGEDIGR
ncbi:AraC family transcriptional regulator [Paenibacillus kobensis]|uniref:AraC family transcriptional regulator n=1 Tax=Paenibacillus kobensis TaxID=59841 RepID=UPI000FDC9722|nr:AraC family transcriptional regulator [Paenibacillus kobensis]